MTQPYSITTGQMGVIRVYIFHVAREVTIVGVEAFSIFAFSVSLSAPEFVVSKFTWRFSKSFSVHRQI